MKKLISALVMLGLLSSFSCKSTISGTESEPPEIPTLDAITIPSPTGLPAGMQSQIATANTLASFGYTYLSAVTDVDPTYENGVWTWQFTNGDLTITVTAAEQDDSTLNWTVVVNGSVPNLGQTFDNWTAITGTSAADGTDGSWTIYELNATTVAGTATWSTDDEDVVTIGLVSSIVSVDFTSTSDGSAGNMQIYQNSVKTFEAEWTASGGTWTSYNQTSGEQADTGSWTN